MKSFETVGPDRACDKHDRHLRDHFELHGLQELFMDQNEQRRVEETLGLIPSSWHSVIDVGCGDGRMSRRLGDAGLEVVAIDWSESGLKHFAGNKIVTDIRRHWPLNRTFDGAICAEVLEHLPLSEARAVVAQMRQFTRQGFIISVPAREDLRTHTTRCLSCGALFHLWGHVQSFHGFDDVDTLIGEMSEKRVFMPYNGITPWFRIDQIRRLLGYYPCSETALCPVCGARLPAPGSPPFWRLGFYWLLARLERLTNPMRQGTGWFVCRYDA